MYSGGVITYFPEHNDAAKQDQYFRDVILKRDESGLWLVDAFNNPALCATPQEGVDLPLPPIGYAPVTK